MKKLLLSIGLVSSFAFGQDYYAPTDKDKEPLARFPIDLTVSSTYPRTMTYTLPLALTGKKNEITLKEVSPATSQIRHFKNDTGVVATCMNGVEGPGCVVQHKGLSIDKQASNDAINFRFADPGLRTAAKEIAESFESGNEPIGFIGALKQRTKKDEWPERGLTSQFMSYFFYERGAARDTLVDFGKNGFYVLNADGKWETLGSLYNVHWSKYHVSGNWTAKGVKGWFDFTFNVDSSKYEGYFAKIEGSNPNPNRQGQWIGTKVIQNYDVPNPN